MTATITAILIMAVIGAFLGFVLAYAARRFHVDEDPRVGKVAALLPGANCGACGLPGCSGFAVAVVAGKVDPSACPPGGATTAQKIAETLGRALTFREKRIAVLACKPAGVNAHADYRGVESCSAAAVFTLGGGPIECRYGCLGYGECLKSCKFDALEMGPDGIPVVVREKCVACGKCVPACPRGLFTIQEESRPVQVLCHNRDKGPQANKICRHACIACRKCEKVCPADAIHVPNFLAEIDYGKCNSCGECVKVCPHQTIGDARVDGAPAARADAPVAS